MLRFCSGRTATDGFTATAAARTTVGRLVCLAEASVLLPRKATVWLSVAGGGDTVAALNQAGVAGDFSYVSTAGGAFLEWMEGKPLPGVEVLKIR